MFQLTSSCKFILTTLLFTLFICSEMTAETVIHDQSKTEVLTPALAGQKTLKLRLDNGLEALLISDSNADQSGAMLAIKVGSWEDPEDTPGLAHFLEHMLFLGTQKYPKESDFDRFITEHGGMTNAFTSNSMMTYLFTVNNDAFNEALNRFSSFFKEPLFNPSGVSREMKAIDQEYAKNVENDDFRLLHVIKELTSPNHPLHRFTIGNSQTLSKVTRVNLENWYQKTYSANLMKLIVYSPLSLSTLQKLVSEEFSGISSSGREPALFDQPSTSPETLGKYIYIEPVKHKRNLTIVWELPQNIFNMRDSQPENLICHVLGHEGEKSLLAQLKREHLADALGCGGQKVGSNQFLFFLSVDLTEQGLIDIDHVIMRCFQAIRNVSQKAFPRYLFDEIQQIQKTNYQYRAKENEFNMLNKHAYRILDEDLATYPEKTLIVQEFSPDSVQKILSYLTPKNARYYIMAPFNETHKTYNQKEKWIGIEYLVTDIPSDDLIKWMDPMVHPEIDLPLPNPFIVNDLHLHTSQATRQELIPQPEVILERDSSKIYYAPDTKFQVPKISWHFQIRTPEVSMKDPTKVVLADLFVNTLKDALNKYSYQAKIAGLEYSVQRQDNGLSISINGYNEKAHLLLYEIANTMQNLNVSGEKYNLIRETLLRKYQNFSKETPLNQSVELFKDVLYDKYVTEKDKATAMRKVTYKNFQDYLDNIFKTFYIEGMLYGNMTKEQGKEVSTKLLSYFKGKPYPAQEQENPYIIVLPQEKGPYYVESHTKSQGNATLLAIEKSDFSFKERAAQQILMRAIKGPFFATLRTKQQTGYLVHSVCEEFERKLFNLFIVQSNTHDPRDLLARFESFIESYLQELGKEYLSYEQFSNIRNSLIDMLEKNPKNIKEMGELLNKLAYKYDADFSWVSKRLQGLSTLSYEEFQEYVVKFLGRQNKQRLAILIEGQIPEANSLSYTRARSLQKIRKVSEYQMR